MYSYTHRCKVSEIHLSHEIPAQLQSYQSRRNLLFAQRTVSQLVITNQGPIWTTTTDAFHPSQPDKTF
ncbi:hypothetical protein VDGE_30191 [Verticillium dahliae]|uniref:Uncharacterized protein n=1 Tax=Verticillium dahliae TaxID=27337 RepID=A0A444RWQ0_VERDA|nr:hypothetical protein VDGE_30191 [Verticillium dahliae]